MIRHPPTPIIASPPSQQAGARTPLVPPLTSRNRASSTQRTDCSTPPQPPSASRRNRTCPANLDTGASDVPACWSALPKRLDLVPGSRVRKRSPSSRSHYPARSRRARPTNGSSHTGRVLARVFRHPVCVFALKLGDHDRLAARCRRGIESYHHVR